jgi:hypothetical protein
MNSNDGSLVELYHTIRQDAAPTIKEIGGHTYTDRQIELVKEPTPTPLRVFSLTALVDYLKVNIDGLDISTLVCHVVEPNHVMLRSKLCGNSIERPTYLSAEIFETRFKYEFFYDSETFNVKLQANFKDGEDKALLLQYVGNTQESDVRNVGDNGITQEITVKTGIVTVAKVELPNPVTLRPFRTFNEIEQPASKFIFRAQKGPEFALFEADNSAWKLEAMLSIKAYLNKHLPDLHVIA